MLETYPIANEIHARQRVLEREFGREWMNEEVKAANREGRAPHPVAKAYKEINSALFQAYQDVQHRKNSTSLFPSSIDTNWLIAINRFSDFAAMLNQVSSLPNYKDAFPKHRLRNAVEFPGVRYEVYVASYLTRLGLDVEFIPKATNETPDFKVSLTKRLGSTLVECKRINPFIKEMSQIASDALHRSLSDKFESVNARLEFSIIKIGNLLAEDVEKIASRCRQIYHQVNKGPVFFRDTSCSVKWAETPHFVLSESERLQPGHPIPSALKEWMEQGAKDGLGNVASFQIGGGMAVTKALGLSFRSIYGNTFNDLVSGIKKGHSQIKNADPSVGLNHGLIFVDVDCESVPHSEINTYLELLGNGLEEYLAVYGWPEVSAIVLTTSDRYVVEVLNDRRKASLSVLLNVCFNPNIDRKQKRIMKHFFARAQSSSTRITTTTVA